MDAIVDPITEADLEAYVEDQLPVARRIEVEAHLCRNPQEAVRVMADLRVRDELRLALAEMPRAPRMATMDAARRLERGLMRDLFFRQVRKVAAVALLVGAGWFTHAEFGPFGVGKVVASVVPPSYVADAVQAHLTAQVRAGMISQPEVPDYDPAELRAATAIELPTLLSGWSVTDVQVFPSAYGPSIEMAIRAPAFGNASLFAVRPGTFDVVPTTIVHEGDLTAAYWQMGEVAYALVTKTDSRELDRAARQLARSLY